MITGLLMTIFAFVAMAFLFVFGVVGTVLKLAFHVTSFGVKVVVKPILSLLLIGIILLLILL